MMVRRHARSEPGFLVAKWLRERRSGRIQLIYLLSSGER